jgi:hypothetical protein
MEHKNLAIDNSFTLLLKNLSGIETNVSLFRLGVDGNSIPVDSEYVQTQYDGHVVFKADPTLPTNQPLTNASQITNQPTNPTNEIRISNDLGNFVSISIATGTTLDDWNTIINDTMGMPTGTEAEVVIGFKSGVLPPAFNLGNEMFYNIKYPSPIGTNSKITLITLIDGASTLPITISTTTEQVAIATNGSTGMVSVKDSANLTYDEILRSQNGSVLDIRSMAYNLLFANEPIDQMNKCFRFSKTDVNGKSYTNFKCPVKDPYQFQNSYGVIDMGRIADRFTLDGETSFDYTLAPFSDCQITFNYAELTNLMLLPDEIKEAREDVVVLDDMNKEDNYKRKITISLPEDEKPSVFLNATGDEGVKSKPSKKKTLKKKAILI